jgi:hypothetical protein
VYGDPVFLPLSEELVALDSLQQIPGAQGEDTEKNDSQDYLLRGTGRVVGAFSLERPSRLKRPACYQRHDAEQETNTTDPDVRKVGYDTSA